MTVRLLAFTDRGYALAQTLAAALDGQAARCGAPQGLAEWTAAAWKESQALVFVGAAGIAVRAIAPHVRHKTVDPAVVVVDEAGRRCEDILTEKRAVLDAVAAYLLEHETMEREAFLEVCAGKTPEKPAPEEAPE